MSHSPERKEKDCLNCGAWVQGRYCHVCGQENIVPRESFSSLVIHFFYDITHFDSKFFDTVRYLAFKPGFLSAEFMRGRRAGYLNPVRMYVFTSAFFFLVFFSIINPKDAITWNVDATEVMTGQERLKYIQKLEKKIKDEPQKKYIQQQIDLLKDTANQVSLKDILTLDTGNVTGVFSTGRSDYLSWREYDSVQQSLPASEKDGWFTRQWKKREIPASAAFRKDPQEALIKISDTFLHKLPYMLFVSLPLFALILKLLYIRRKQFYFADHGIFSIHLYIFAFLLLLLVFAFDALKDVNGFAWVKILSYASFVLFVIYLYKAMRTFYGQGRAKTVFKFLLLNLFSFMMVIILASVFFFLSALGI